MMLNNYYKIRVASNPRELLSTDTGLPATLAVGALKKLEKEGKSPVKTQSYYTRIKKKQFPGFREAMSTDFPDLLNRKNSESPPPDGPRYFTNQITSSADMQKRLAIRYSLKDKHSQVYKFNEAQQRARAVVQMSADATQSFGQTFSGFNTTRRSIKAEMTPLKVSIDMEPPTFKGSQAPKSTKAAYEQPVSKMHAQIMQNYRVFKQAIDERQATEQTQMQIMTTTRASDQQSTSHGADFTITARAKMMTSQGVRPERS
jgi:hypothetical protein